MLFIGDIASVERYAFERWVHGMLEPAVCIERLTFEMQRPLIAHGLVHLRPEIFTHGSRKHCPKIPADQFARRAPRNLRSGFIHIEDPPIGIKDRETVADARDYTRNSPL